MDPPSQALASFQTLSPRTQVRSERGDAADAGLASDYLEKVGAKESLQEALMLLLKHRPDAPMNVLISFFQSKLTSVPHVTLAYRQFQLAKRKDGLAMDTIAEAYKLLSHKPSVDSGPHDRKVYGTKFPARWESGSGLLGRDYMELLGMACSDFSPHASDTILRCFLKQDHEAVSFEAFHCALATCYLYEVFIKRTAGLFHSLDTGSGVVKKDLCESILQSLASSVAASPQRTQARAVLHEQLLREHASNSLGATNTEAAGVSSVVKLSTFMRSASHLFLQIVVVSRAGVRPMP